MKCKHLFPLKTTDNIGTHGEKLLETDAILNIGVWQLKKRSKSEVETRMEIIGLSCYNFAVDKLIYFSLDLDCVPPL